jgi:molecular chaperone Hsp33
MSDELIRAMGLGGRARAIVARTTSTVEELRRVHDPSPEVAAALGRLATGTLLLAATLEKVTRREPMITVEIHGNGPAGRLVATASPRGWVRGFATNPQATAPPRADGKLDVAAVVGEQGQLIVTRDPGIGHPYRGVVPLFSGEIAKDLAFYLSDSEQTPSAVALGVFAAPQGVRHAGGLMLQLLPGVSDAEAAELTRRTQEIGLITDSLRDGNQPLDWLQALFGGELQVLETKQVSFRCGCSEERVEAAVKLLGATEVGELLRESRLSAVSLTCEFCRREYPMPTAQLERLLAEVIAETQPQ